MPIVTVDGKRYNVADTNPKTIEQAIAKRKSIKSSSDSVIGDIGRGFVAGAVSIPQGLATLPTTGIDLLFDTDITDDVNEFFEAIKPDVEGAAGKTAQMVTQFGIPGLGVASALSKLTKLQQLGTMAAVDAAVATDDVDTFTDMLFDKESDEERLKNLEGRDAALARLTERLQVFGETAAVMYAAPIAISGAVKGVGAGLDLVAPYMNALAKAATNTSEGVAAAGKADRNLWDHLRKNFTYGGIFEQTAANNKVIKDASQAKMLYTANLVNPINDSMNMVRKTVEEAVSVGGKMNADDALSFTKALSTYRAPMLAVEREFPNLKGSLKKSKMIQYQKDAMKTIKSFEGSGNKIDYEALGVAEGNKISKIMENNTGLFAQEQQLILDFSKKDPTTMLSRLLIPDEMRNAISENVGKYGTTVYRSIIDKNYIVPKDLKEKAIREITNAKIPGLESKEAIENAFDQLAKPRNTKLYETPEMFTGNITFGQLQGKDLQSLPAVREALGEITPFNYTKSGDWKEALKNEALAASSTMAKLGSIAGNAKYLDEIKILNDTAEASGRAKFLKTAEDLKTPIKKDKSGEALLDPNGNLIHTLPDSYMGPNGVTYYKFGKDGGALINTYAPEVFHKSILESSNNFLQLMPTPLRKLFTGLVGLKAIGQYGKTILGPTAQIRNNTSVPFMALMNANLGPSGQFTKNFKMAFAGVLDPRNKTQYAAEIKEAQEYGIMVGKGTQLQEISDIATYAIDDVGLLSQLKGGSVANALQKVKAVPENIYTGSDNAARQINWSGEQFKLSKVIAKSSDSDLVPINSGKNMADPDIQKLIEIDPVMGPVVNVGKLKSAVPIKKGDDILDKFIKGESANIALNVTPTYSRVPEIIRQLKYVPFIGNFTAFPAEVIRNAGNTMSRAIKELASSNLELQKVGARRLAGGLTTTVGIPAGLTATALAMTGADQEQLDAYKRSFAAPWEKTATMIPTGTDSAGNITGLYNFSYTNPYDFLQKPFKALMNAYAEGNINEAGMETIAADGLFNAITEITTPFIGLSMGAKSITEAVNGKTETGKTIFNESDMLGERTMKQFLHVTNAIAPTITPIKFEVDADGVQIVPKDFITAAASLVTGEKDLISPRGKPIDVAETMVSAFSGIKVVKPQIQRSLYYKAAESKRAIRETTNEFNRLLRSNNRKDAEDFIQGYMNTNKDRYNSLRTLYTAIEDARTLGLGEAEIDEQLKIAKVASRDMVMMGLFNPSEVNPDVLQFAMRGTENKAAQDVPLANLYETQSDMFGQGLQGQFSAPSSSSSPVMPQIRTASQVLREEEEKKLLGTP
jgi:hypothetical protein